jgi:hypothetical protein
VFSLPLSKWYYIDTYSRRFYTILIIILLKFSLPHVNNGTSK